MFEERTTLEELLKKSIRLSVMQSSCFLKKSSIIGEININLLTVWKQKCEFYQRLLRNLSFFTLNPSSDHAFLKKWAVLEKVGQETANTTTGYLQIDLNIVSSHELPAPATLQTFNDDIVEG